MKRFTAVFILPFLIICLFSSCYEIITADRDVTDTEAYTNQTETEPVTEETAAETETEPETETETETETEDLSGSSFEIYFLDVGQGDSACVICDGKTMLIDGGPVSASSLLYSFLKYHGITHLDYVIATHPDTDHIGGLAGALNYATADKALCTVTEYESKPFNNFIKYLQKQGGELSVPDIGRTFELGKSKVTVIYPEAGAVNTGNTSIALRIEYGGTSFFFTGDCEDGDEKSMIESGAILKSDVLKIAHHGSRSSTTQAFLDKVDPAYAVISVGGGNTYGHPTKEVLDRLKEIGAVLYRTDIYGDIHCVSDGKTVTFDVEKNGDVDAYTAPGGYNNYLYSLTGAETEETAASDTVPDKTAPESGQTAETGTAAYIANTNTMKFHRPGCPSVSDISEHNRMYFEGTRQELINMGYAPCRRCNP